MGLEGMESSIREPGTGILALLDNQLSHFHPGGTAVIWPLVDLGGNSGHTRWACSKLGCSLPSGKFDMSRVLRGEHVALSA